MASILPPNSTPLEYALEAAIKLEELPTPIETIRDPWKCPSQFLALSAWENHVNYWNDDWPEATKRQVVASTPEVKRYVGTVHGVEFALSALGYSAQLSQWFEYGGDPGYFNLDVNLFDRGISAEDQVDILGITEVTKRQSQHLDTLTIHQASQDALPSIGIAVLYAEEITIAPYQVPEDIQTSTIPIIAVMFQTVEEITIMPKEAV